MPLAGFDVLGSVRATQGSRHPAATSMHQVRKNTNQTMPSISTATPSETTNSANTDGPGSAWRASVGVSTMRPCSLVAMATSIRECYECLPAQTGLQLWWATHDQC